jgi:lipopolysaccharide/colanic/teichoic acid biosynthesis glycosyltransferase
MAETYFLRFQKDEKKHFINSFAKRIQTLCFALCALLFALCSLCFALCALDLILKPVVVTTGFRIKSPNTPDPREHRRP